ncbi:MAG TPA: hypothetical protein VFG04_04660 [Planctomycetaceae bacterium]|jgi:hypothetical protein|nr:hypothetical protein [Planctomycetaceae bacterium]
MKISSGLAFALVLVCASAGCVSEINSCATWVHQSWTTDKAWRSHKWMFEGVDCASSFKAGFKAGHRFATCGGDSCQPPGPSHFWCTNGMTEEDQREAQAWCDGFTHGTLCAQQDGNATASALDAQTAQPPENVPEVYYYSNPGELGSGGIGRGGIGSGEIGSIGSSPSLDPFAQGQFAPQLYPPTGTAPPNWSTAAAPADVAYSPAAPPSEALELPMGQKGTPSRRYSNSSALPGIGSLRTTVGPNASDRVSPPTSSLDRTLNAPPGGALAGAVPPAPGSPTPLAHGPYQPNSSTSIAPKAVLEGAPSTLPTPSIPPAVHSAVAPQWELPIIRN